MDLEDPRRFDESGIEPIDWSDRPAFLLSADLRAACGERHLAKLRELVQRIGNRDAREHQWLLQAAPSGWRADEAVSKGRLEAFVAGLAVVR